MRAWAKVAVFAAERPKLTDLDIKIIAGMVGTSAAMAFKQSLHETGQIKPEQILLNFSRNKKKLADLSLQDLAGLNERLLLWLNSQGHGEEQAAKVKKNFLSYLKHLQTQKRQEAVAHCANLLQDRRFEATMGLLAQDMEIVEFLTDYIEGIKV